MSKSNPIDHLWIKVACINTVTLCHSPCSENVPTCTLAIDKYHGLRSCLVYISSLLLILSDYILSNTVTFEFLPLESLNDIVDYKRLFVTSPILLMDIFMIN